MSVFDSIKQMFNNKDDSQKHYKKGDYKSLVAETMNSLDKLDGVKMDNSYVSPYEKRDFANSVEIVDKDPKAESFSRHAAQQKAKKINNNIPKQTEDSFASMMKKTVNSPENQMNQNPIPNKEDSFSTMMKKKVNSYNKDNSATYNPSNYDESQKQELENRNYNTNIQPERESKLGSGLLRSLENRNPEQYNWETLVPNGEEWKNFDEIYALTNLPILNNEMTIETIMGMSSKMSNMPMELRKSSILSYLASKNIDPISILEDGERKSKAIEIYESFIEKRINKRKKRIESEIELLQKKILEREEILTNDEKNFSEWKNEKTILEDMMKEAFECLGKSNND